MPNLVKALDFDDDAVLIPRESNITKFIKPYTRKQRMETGPYTCTVRNFQQQGVQWNAVEILHLLMDQHAQQKISGGIPVDYLQQFARTCLPTLS